MGNFDTYVRMIDLSRYQEGPNDFTILAKGGYVGAVQRWGVGTYRDPTRFTNLRAIIAAGLVPGTYYVPAANQDGSDQATRFIHEVRDFFSDQPMLYVVDIEHSNSFGDPSAALAADFVAAGHQITGRPMGGYIPKWYMDQHGWTTTQVNRISPHAWWWQSRYDSTPAITNPPDGGGYKGWPLRAWQWTSSGPAPGIPGDVDKNVFYGSLVALRAAAGYAPLDPPVSVKKEEKMLYLIKGHDTTPWWLTDFITKRHVQTREDAAIVIWMSTVAGQPVQHDGGLPIVMAADQQDFIDRIPVVA